MAAFISDLDRNVDDDDNKDYDMENDRVVVQMVERKSLVPSIFIMRFVCHMAYITATIHKTVLTKISHINIKKRTKILMASNTPADADNVSLVCRKMITYSERRVIHKALQSFSLLDKSEKDKLDLMFSLSGFGEMPKEEKFRSQVVDIATDKMIERSRKFVQVMRKGIPEQHLTLFWGQLTSPSVTLLYEMQRPTPHRVVDVIQVEDELQLRPDEHLCLYFLKEYILGLDQEDLATFLHFVTGASVLPEEINVAFNAVSGFMRHPTAHTCGNMLELPATYSSMQELKREFQEILRNQDAFQMTAI